MLAKNGYPRTFVDNCIRGFLNSKHTDTKRTNQITTPPTQKHLKTLEANVVKSLFAVLSKLNLKVLQCHRR